MANEFKDRQMELVRDHLAWTTLHHFLPADLARELAIATLEAVRPGTTLSELFDESLSLGPSLQSSWALAPQPVDDEDKSFLQHHIRALAWGNDADVTFDRRENRPKLKALAAARRLGCFDFGTSVSFIESLPLTEGSSGQVLASAIASAVRANEAGDEKGWMTATEAAGSLPAPLSALGLKHLGDLCADADLWERALTFYENARARIEAFGPIWAEFGILFKDIVIQSRANALWALGKAHAAIADLENLANVASDRSIRLGVLNARHDALVAKLAIHDFSNFADRRSTVMAPPLLIQSWDTGHATQSWIKGATDVAYRQFWSVLRRQVALGAIADAKETKAVFGRALIGESAERPNAKFDPSSFELGIGLLIESGAAKTAAALDLSAASTKRYLTPAFITRLARKVDGHLGTKDERTIVFFELLYIWGSALDADQGELAELMLRQIIDRVRTRVADVDASRNVAGRGLKILSDLAIKSANFRNLVSSDVVDLIVEQVDGKGFWKAKEDALTLARLYIDVLSPSDLQRILKLVARFLIRDNAKREIFVTRAALNFLTTPQAITAAAGDPDLGSRFFREILHSNIEQGGQDITTLLTLAAFGSAVKLTSEDAEKLSAVVKTVGEQARAFNSTSVVDAIHALLSAASQSGAEGVDLAIESLIDLLSIEADRSSPGFPYAYWPVLDLLKRGDAIRSGAAWSEAEFKARLDKVLEALALAWRRIAEKPKRLAAFSIPPSTTPDPTLIQNWAFVTLEAIRTAANGSALEVALVRAEQNPELAHRIKLARAMSATGFGSAEMSSGLKTESSEIFYQALGHRLNLVQDYEAVIARRTLGALLSEVLRRGPRELDLAVFVSTRELDQETPDLLVQLKAYRARLRNNAHLQRILGPAAARLRAMFSAPIEADED